MIRVPIFEELRSSDATIYSFTINNQDLTRLISDGNQKSIPSKFVCLNLPDWKDVAPGTRQLFLDPAQFGTNPLITDPNKLLPALLQNYVENLVANSQQDEVDIFDITEIAFWKMLRHIGAIDLVNSDGLLIDDLGDGLVQYIGDINIMNHLAYKGQEYTETYLHIPHNAQKTTGVQWDIAQSIQSFTKLPLNENGTNESLGIDGVNDVINKALYDRDGNNQYLSYYEFAEAADRAKLNFDTYQKTNADIEFNTILIYYDLITTNANGITSERKLGQVMFLKDFELIAGTSDYRIPTAKKYQSIEGQTGNSIAYRINSKHFFGVNNVNAQSVINQYNTISMDLYMDALHKMMALSKTYQEDRTILTELQNAVLNMQMSIGTQLSYTQLSNQISAMQSTINRISSGSNNTLNITTAELLSVFNQLSQQIQGEGVNINNTFQFVTGEAGNYLPDYIALNESNEAFVKYSNNSLLSQLSFVNFFNTRTLITTSIANGSPNRLRLSLTPADDSVLRAVINNISNLALSAELSTEIDFRLDAQVPTQRLWYYNTANSQVVVASLSSILLMTKSAIDNILPIAVFILPTEAEFTTRGLHGIYKFSSNVPFTPAKEFVEQTANGVAIKYSRQTLLTKLQRNQAQLIARAHLQTSYDSNDGEIDITVSPVTAGNIQLRRADHTLLAINTNRTVSVPVAANTGAITTYILELLFNGDSSDVSLALRSYEDVLAYGIYDANAVPLAIISIPTAAQASVQNAIEFTPVSVIRYLNINPIEGGAADVNNATLGLPTAGAYNGAIDFLGMLITDAFDAVGNILEGVIPPSPPNAATLSVVGVNSSSGSLSFDDANPISGSTYVGANNAGANPISVDQVFNIATSRGGIISNTSRVTGIVNIDTALTQSYAQYAVKDGDVGTIRLLLNGLLVDSVDLAASNTATDNTAGNTATGLSVSALQNVIYPTTGKPFSTTYRTISFNIMANDANAVNGYNYVQVEHNTGATTHSTNVVDFVIDHNAVTVAYSALSLIVDALTGLKYLSGVSFRTGGNLHLSATIDNVYRNTFVAGNAISLVGSDVQNTLAAVANSAGDEAASIILTNVDTALNATGISLLAATTNVQINLQTTIRGIASSAQIVSPVLVVDNINQPSTETLEYFRDETYRAPANVDFDDANVIAEDMFDSEQSVIDGAAGYTNAMQVLPGQLIYPGGHTTLPADYRTATLQYSHPNNDLSTKGSPRNYSTAIGARHYTRWFRQIIPTTSNFRLKINGDSNIELVSKTVSLTAKKCHVEIKLPGVTGWMDAYKDFETGQIAEGDGARSAFIGLGGINQWLGLTSGTGSTASSQGYVWVRLSFADNFDGKLTQLSFEFV